MTTPSNVALPSNLNPNLSQKKNNFEEEELEDDDNTEDENTDDDEIVDRIIEESPNKRFQKRNRRFARPVPGVDDAFLALEPETGKEYIWNEIYTNCEETSDAESQLLSVVKRLKKNYHPFLIRFYEIWVSNGSNLSTPSQNELSPDIPSINASISTGLNSVDGNPPPSSNVDFQPSTGGVSLISSSNLTSNVSVSQAVSTTGTSPSQVAVISNNKSSNNIKSKVGNIEGAVSDLDRKSMRRSTSGQSKNTDNKSGANVKSSQSPRKIIFITERLVEGSLKQYVQNSSKTARAWKKYIGQILSVLRFLNSHGLNHGHLTNENIFFQSSGALKIGTFTLDEFINRKCTIDSQHHRTLTRYLAPEYRLDPNEKITREGDIFALGVLALELAAWEPSWADLLVRSNADTLEPAYNERDTQAALRQTIIKDYERILSLLDRVQDVEQRDFINLCLKFDPKERPSIKELPSHPAMIEVPTLRLMAAKVIVHQIRNRFRMQRGLPTSARPNVHLRHQSSLLVSMTREEKLKLEREINQDFTNSLAQLVDDVTCHLENDTVIGQINFRRENAVKLRTWKDYNFVESTKKFLDDVRHGYYLLFGCRPPYQSGSHETGQKARSSLTSHLRGGAESTHADWSMPVSSQTQISVLSQQVDADQDKVMITKCSMESNDGIHCLSNGVALNEIHLASSDPLTKLSANHKDSHQEGVVEAAIAHPGSAIGQTSSIAGEPNAAGVSKISHHPELLSLTSIEDCSLIPICGLDEETSSIAEIQDDDDESKRVESSRREEPIDISKSAVSRAIGQSGGAQVQEMSAGIAVTSSSTAGTVTSSSVTTVTTPAPNDSLTAGLEENNLFQQRADMSRPRMVEISSKTGEDKLVDYRHCVIQDCEFKYVGCGRWHLTLTFYLLNEKMSEQIKRGLAAQYLEDEWHDSRAIVTQMIGHGVIRPEHARLFLTYVQLAVHNRPTRDFEISAASTACSLDSGKSQAGVDPNELRRRLELLKNMLREDYSSVLAHMSGLAVAQQQQQQQQFRVEELPVGKPALMEVDLTDNVATSGVGLQSRSTNDGLSNTLDEEANKELIGNAENSTKQSTTTAGRTSSPSTAVRLQQEEQNNSSISAHSSTNVVSTANFKHSVESKVDEILLELRQHACTVPLSHLGALYSRNVECAICDQHEYLHRTDIAIYLSSPCYHCREYFAKKAGLTPLAFMMLHYEYQVPWPAYLAVRCGLPFSQMGSVDCVGSLERLIEYDCRIRRRQPCRCYPGRVLPPCTEFSWSYRRPVDMTPTSGRPSCDVPGSDNAASIPLAASQVDRSTPTGTPLTLTQLASSAACPDPHKLVSASSKDEEISERSHDSAQSSPAPNDLTTARSATTSAISSTSANPPSASTSGQSQLRGIDSQWYTSSLQALRVCHDQHVIGGLTLCAHGAIIPVEAALSSSSNAAGTSDPTTSTPPVNELGSSGAITASSDLTGDKKVRKRKSLANIVMPVVSSGVQLPFTVAS